MKWFEIELEIPIYGKSFEIVQAFDSETAIQIAIKITDRIIEHRSDRKTALMNTVH